MAEERFTWTYGASEGRTIFINDNNLQDPKGNGIAVINCHRIGNEEAERLARLWIASSDLLNACKQTLKEMRAYVGESEFDKSDPSQWIFDLLKSAIAKVEGKEVKDV